MEIKKAFQEIYAHAKIELELYAPELLHRLELRKDVVEKDLDRLEKQDKAIEIIKTKHIDINELIKYMKCPLFNDTNNKAIDYYNLIHMYELSQEEWDLLKEVFG